MASLALATVAFPGDAHAAHSGLVFTNTLIGMAAFVLGFALTWGVLAVRWWRRRRRARGPHGVDVSEREVT